MSRDDAGMGWGWYFAWFAVGAAYTLAALGAMSIGILVLPVAVAATIVVATRRTSSVGLPGLVSGFGLPFLYVAFLNRDGPGTVCSVSANATDCTDEMSPWPWLVMGVVLIAVGVLVFVRRSRAREQRGVPPPAT
ncbi:MAG: hypothetical protein ACXVJ7_05535 [Acidimicrobiia bacterium]